MKLKNAAAFLTLIQSLVFSGVLFVTPAKAVDIAFLESKDSNGHIEELEPNFPYSHVAISWNGGWLHSHPATGVQWVTWEDLHQFGEPMEKLPSRIEALDPARVSKYMGKPYDHRFSWDDDFIYCSELVAKLLDMAPRPMHFDPALWPPSFQQYEGLPGISPSEVYHRLGGHQF